VTVTTSSANTSANSRSATVTFSASGVSSINVTVTQSGATPTLSILPTSQTVGSGSGTNGSIAVTSNTSWRVNDDAAWLTIAPASGTGNGSVTVTTSSANTSITPRSATVTFSASGVSSVDVTVTQSGATPTLTVLSTSLTVGSGSGTTGSIAVTSNTIWSVIDDATWLTVIPASGTGDGSVAVTTISANISTESRSATVTFSAFGVSSKNVTVTQSGAIPTLNLYDSYGKILYKNDTLKIDQSETGFFYLEVESNEEWSVSENALWFKALHEGSTSLKVTYMENVSVIDKISTLKVKSPNNEIILNVLQKARVSVLRSSIQKFSNVKMFPNPAISTIYLDMGNEKFDKVIISVTNIQGNLLKIREYKNLSGNQILEVSVSEFPTGQYWIQVGDEIYRKVFQLVKF